MGKHMSLKTAMQHLGFQEAKKKVSNSKWGPCHKEPRQYSSNDTVIDVDKNRQIISVWHKLEDGSLNLVHPEYKGRPIKIINKTVCIPVFIEVEDPETGLKTTQFDYWHELLTLNSED